MVAHPLRRAAATLLLDRPEHARHRAGVVAGARHDLRAEDVSLLLVLAAVLQEGGAEAELSDLRDGRPGPAADDGAEDRAADLPHLILAGRGCLRRAMPQRHVADLVRQHARHLPFRLGLLDHAAVRVHRPAGQRKGVDLAQIDDVEGVAELVVAKLGRNVLDEPGADPIDVVVDPIVVQHRHLLLDFGRRLTTELHVVGRAVLVFGRRDLRLRRHEEALRTTLVTIAAESLSLHASACYAGILVHQP